MHVPLIDNEIKVCIQLEYVIFDRSQRIINPAN